MEHLFCIANTVHIVCNKTKLRTSLYNVSPIISTFIWYFSFFYHVTLIATPCRNLQMIEYLELVEVWGRENNRGVFLWLVSNIKVSVTASYVMGKCQTDVFESVFCDARESMESRHNGGWLRDSAVSLLTPSNTPFYPYWRAKSV